MDASPSGSLLLLLATLQRIVFFYDLLLELNPGAAVSGFNSRYSCRKHPSARRCAIDGLACWAAGGFCLFCTAAPPPPAPCFRCLLPIHGY